MQFKSQLDRWISIIYFPNYKKLKSCVETFTPYNQTLFLEEKLCMSIDFYSYTDQELINNVHDYRVSSLEAHYYIYPDLHSVWLNNRALTLKCID